MKYIYCFKDRSYMDNWKVSYHFPQCTCNLHVCKFSGRDYRTHTHTDARILTEIQMYKLGAKCGHFLCHLVGQALFIVASAVAAIFTTVPRTSPADRGSFSDILPILPSLSTPFLAAIVGHFLFWPNRVDSLEAWWSDPAINHRSAGFLVTGMTLYSTHGEFGIQLLLILRQAGGSWLNG